MKKRALEITGMAVFTVAFAIVYFLGTVGIKLGE
jgi:hypothetical protein